MPKGGARPGAGRKPGLQAEAYRRALLDLVEKNKRGLAQALVDKGLSGDVPALKEINERMLGKVAQELTGKDGKDLFPVPILSKVNVHTDDSNPKDSEAD
jgi:hypothetical protein